MLKTLLKLFWYCTVCAGVLICMYFSDSMFLFNIMSLIDQTSTLLQEHLTTVQLYLARLHSKGKSNVKKNKILWFHVKIKPSPEPRWGKKTPLLFCCWIFFPNFKSDFTICMNTSSYFTSPHGRYDWKSRHVPVYEIFYTGYITLQLSFTCNCHTWQQFESFHGRHMTSR